MKSAVSAAVSRSSAPVHLQGSLAYCENVPILQKSMYVLNFMHEICPVDLNDAAYVFKFAVILWKS